MTPRESIPAAEPATDRGGATESWGTVKWTFLPGTHSAVLRVTRKSLNGLLACAWRRADHKDAWFLQSALPGVQIEDASGFADRNAANIPYILERAVIVDRCKCSYISF